MYENKGSSVLRIRNEATVEGRKPWQAEAVREESGRNAMTIEDKVSRLENALERLTVETNSFVRSTTEFNNTITIAIKDHDELIRMLSHRVYSHEEIMDMLTRRAKDHDEMLKKHEQVVEMLSHKAQDHDVIIERLSRKVYDHDEMIQRLVRSSFIIQSSKPCLFLTRSAHTTTC